MDLPQILFVIEVDDQQPAGVEAGAGCPRIEVNVVAAERSEEADHRFRKGIGGKCVRLWRPEKCDGRRNTKAIEAFIVYLEAYITLHSESEQSNAIVASCLLT